VTGAISFARNDNDEIVDISEVSNDPAVNTELYLDDTWMLTPSETEVLSYINSRPKEIQPTVRSADFSTMKSAKAAPKPKPKMENTSRTEATIDDNTTLLSTIYGCKTS